MKTNFIKSFSRIFASVIVATGLIYGLTSGIKAHTTNTPTINKNTNSSTVYITPNGECYHSTPKCRTLRRSKQIKSVDINEAQKTRRPCKVCH